MPVELSKEPSSSTRAHAQTLVLGLGNDILRDDAMGLMVARAVRERLVQDEAVAVEECCEMGLSLLDYMVDFHDLILVDAVQTHTAPPGHIHVLTPDQLKVLPGTSPHFLGVGEVLALGRQLGMVMPERVVIFAVEVEDPFTVGTEMTPVMNQTLPLAVERILATLHVWREG